MKNVVSIENIKMNKKILLARTLRENKHTKDVHICESYQKKDELIHKFNDFDIKNIPTKVINFSKCIVDKFTSSCCKCTIKCSKSVFEFFIFILVLH